MKFETLAVHPVERGEPSGARPVIDSISLSTIYERHANGDYPEGYSYTRASNPNRDDLEQALAHLEGGTTAAAFSSGSAATSTVFQALSPGDHVVCTEGFYGTRKLLEQVYRDWGLTFTLLDTSNAANVQAAMRRETRLVWIETPTNPMMRVTDIRRICEIARQQDATSIVDNTVASPVLQQPLDLGADMVMHSTTKYLGGHSDILGGAIIARTKTPLFDRIRMLQSTAGAVPSPFECWLLLRGIRTLPLRVRSQASHALAIAEYLSSHSNVESVLYPGLPAHPGHEIAAQQMRGGYGGLLSFLVKGSDKEALAMTSHLKLITRATSLGGVETTIDHRYSVEPPGTPTPKNLLRLSVGIEHIDDLIEDLDQALSKI
ncbi:MAG TPA: aminotransferase class I/II-fold pyridoxal phosphate-dependent enzyme [Terriglobales bacterium]|nr:aminotransferase class I/II-fold pyridoxal phosphate-dependent enzyme [Terriglobales bacterium]